MVQGAVGNYPGLYQNILKLSNLGLLDTLREVSLGAFANHKSLDVAYKEIAIFLFNAGQPELSQIYFKLSLDLAFTAHTYSLYLQCLLLSPTCTYDQMFHAASEYSSFFTQNITQYSSYRNRRDPKKRLNVGYICHFFYNCVSESLLNPFIRAHNRDRVKVFCYSDTAPAEVSDEIKSIGDVWCDTKEMTDKELAARIQEDEIDILLELNGHCIINRYGVISSKPAPVQISFYNIATTSGISAIDYVMIGDEVTINEEQKKYYTEAIYFIKGVTGIAVFPQSFPDCAPPPCLKNHYITFGSFNASHKVNEDVVKLWCKVLKRVPTAKFYMKAAPLTHQPYVDFYKAIFAAEGIELDRIHFEGFSEHHVMLECYANVDIALDTFPHGAGTTTMEALWQGIPVIALYGERYCMQHGKMILTSVGHPELVAYSEEEYIEKAAALASQPKLLQKYRQTLRQDFKNSTKADPIAFASKLEDAYADMWARYCAKQESLQPEH